MSPSGKYFDTVQRAVSQPDLWLKPGFEFTVADRVRYFHLELLRMSCGLAQRRGEFLCPISTFVLGDLKRHGCIGKYSHRVCPVMVKN